MPKPLWQQLKMDSSSPLQKVIVMIGCHSISLIGLAGIPIGFPVDGFQNQTMSVDSVAYISIFVCVHIKLIPLTFQIFFLFLSSFFHNVTMSHDRFSSLFLQAVPKHKTMRIFFETSRGHSKTHHLILFFSELDDGFFKKVPHRLALIAN
jgi:hypothetical protein